MDPVHVEAPTAKHSYTYDHARPAVTADVVAFTFRGGKLLALLVRRGHAPFAGAWALPGGFVEMDEELAAAARRELSEETGVQVAALDQLRAYGAPDRDPRTRVITVAYVALLGAREVDDGRLAAGSDAGEAAWWDVAHLPELAFDHAAILADALQWLRREVESTTASFRLLAAEFTLADAQELVEVVLARRMDKRKFRRKMLAGGRLEETGLRRASGRRPVKFYRVAGQG